MNLKYKELENIYKTYFSIGYTSKNLQEKFALISLICYVYYKNKQKNPDLTYYQLVMKLTDKLGFSDDFIKGLAIVCSDFGYQCTEFPTFGLKGTEIIPKIREILSNWLPF